MSEQLEIIDDWEKQSQVEKASRVINYLNNKTGQNFRSLNPAKKPTSNSKLIIERLKEGYTKEDFQNVINTQCVAWLNDDKMSVYLRPKTLFAKSNFENYLDLKDVDDIDIVKRKELASQPDPRQDLKDFLRLFSDRGGSWGYEMPENPQMAADWWINTMQEPCAKSEVMRKVNKKNAKSAGETFWSYPYLDRLFYTLKKYLSFPREDQVVIVGCVDEGVPWRGDDIDIYYTKEKSIYNQTIFMREVTDEFGRDGFNEFKQCVLRRRAGLTLGAI